MIVSPAWRSGFGVERQYCWYYRKCERFRHTDIVLDRKSLFLEYLSSGEERPSFLACKRLDVHGSE